MSSRQSGKSSATASCSVHRDHRLKGEQVQIRSAQFRPRPEGVKRLWEMLDGACREVGRGSSEIKLSVSAYYEQRSTANNIEAPVVVWEGWQIDELEERFRNHVIAYYAVGVRTFLFNIPPGAPKEALEHIARLVIPDLKLQFATDLSWNSRNSIQEESCH